MPNTTVNFDLPYPNGTDDPCDFAEQWCSFADAVNAVLDGFQATIDRTVPIIPAAQLRATTPRAYSDATGNNVIFDAIGFDTAGWTNFDADPKTIFTDRAGLLVHLGNVEQAPDGVNSLWELNFDGTPGVPTVPNTILDRGVATQTHIGNWLSRSQRNTTANQVSLHVDGTQNSFTINAAHLTVYWHADTVRPS